MIADTRSSPMRRGAAFIAVGFGVRTLFAGGRILLALGGERLACAVRSGVARTWPAALRSTATDPS